MAKARKLVANERSYEVGYGKPPVETRFKKGQSGNPAGRPRHRPLLETMAREALYRKVPVKIGGKTRNLTVIEAAYQKLTVELLTGSPEKVIPILKYLEPIFQRPPPTGAVFDDVFDLRRLDDEELREFDRLMKKAKRDSWHEYDLPGSSEA
ncbi:DUF5681 domain-containing protein [Aurantiacibacter sp. MUD11]|uniref:DUF5681 domain-containing protein n=1 Tax=Aurantiacibacter sp. MUD11 TaxID=3003265 RepID=UPI0022AA86AB|nr:DUF5681 domain-containing protein [Aurantiacibacter sp. MUD11]WAT19277.1 DUF5681 domain-containing protein [Aurantiacibacter sp. MUD11]